MKPSLIAILPVLLLFLSHATGGEIILETRIRWEPGSIDESVKPRPMAIPAGEKPYWFTTVFQPDGKLLAAGYEILEHQDDSGATSFRGHLFRANADGTLDITFVPQLGCGTNGMSACPYLYYYRQPFNVYSPSSDSGPVWLQPDGRILVRGGDHPLSAFNLVRLLADGSKDKAFVPDLSSFEIPDRILSQPDGRIIVSGDFGLRRLNADGSRDTTFGVQLDSQASLAVALQPDGKLLVRGGFTTVNGIARMNLVRLKTDGTIDGSFTPPAIFDSATNSWINFIGIARDGSIWVTVPFSFGPGSVEPNFVRLKSNGDLDSTFKPPIYVTQLYRELSDGTWFASVFDIAGWHNFLHIKRDGSMEWGASALGIFGLGPLANGNILAVRKGVEAGLEIVQLRTTPQAFAFSQSSRQPDGRLRLVVEGGMGIRGSVSLQGSIDLKHWIDLSGLPLNNETNLLHDPDSSYLPSPFKTPFNRRFYRMHVTE